jgi:predicted MPP superfamily phosphohydrolase
MILSLLIGTLLLSGCTQAEEDVYQTSDTTDFTAVVTSDLHFTVNVDSSDAVVPAEPYASEFMEAFVNQVIAIHPDVFIMTGDNTNSGSDSDEAALSVILKRVKDAGIPIVMTTGNHDYDFSDAETYEKNFGDLLDMDEKDSSSLSYVKRIGDVTLLAMDDGAEDQGKTPVFSDETMKWLKKELEAASSRNDKILFLAHRSVLYKRGDSRYDSYHIQNKGLYDLLVKYHVQLVLSGHQHHFSILNKDSLHEIISGMPLADNHRFGVLSIKGKQVDYATEKIDFDTYGTKQCVSDMSAADQQAAQNQKETIDGLLQAYVNDPMYAQAENLLSSIFISLYDGSLSSKVAQFTSDPAFALVQKALADTNYGPWLNDLLKNPPADPNHLSFVWQDGR